MKPLVKIELGNNEVHVEIKGNGVAVLTELCMLYELHPEVKNLLVDSIKAHDGYTKSRETNVNQPEIVK